MVAHTAYLDGKQEQAYLHPVPTTIHQVAVEQVGALLRRKSCDDGVVSTTGARNLWTLKVTVETEDGEGVVQLAVHIAADGECGPLGHIQVNHRTAVLVVPLRK
jgi:hypothetical protein